MYEQVQAFYTKAIECHRFHSWMKHYLDMTTHTAVSRAVEERAACLGVNLATVLLDTFPETCSESGPFPTMRRTAVQRRPVLERTKMDDVLQKAFARFVMKRLNYSQADAASILSVDFRTMVQLELELDLFVFETVVSQSRLVLSRAWSEFIEFFVLPGSSVKKYTIKKMATMDRYYMCLDYFYSSYCTYSQLIIEWWRVGGVEGAASSLHTGALFILAGGRSHVPAEQHVFFLATHDEQVLGLQRYSYLFSVKVES